MIDIGFSRGRKRGQSRNKTRARAGDQSRRRSHRILLARGGPITKLKETSVRGRQLGHIVVEAFVSVGDRDLLLGGAQHGEKIGNQDVLPFRWPT